MAETNKPVKKFIVPPVSVSVWEQENEKDGKKFKTNSLTIQRTYKDKEGNYKNTQSLRVADLPKLQVALTQAYEFFVTFNVE